MRLRIVTIANNVHGKAQETSTAPNYDYDIFVSYANADLQQAKEIDERLRAAGLLTFMANKGIAGGDDFAEKIRQGLLSSREVCLLMTPRSLKSEWVTTEWGAAWALAKRITPILFQCAPDDLPDRISRLQCIDLHEMDKYIREYGGRTATREPDMTNEAQQASVALGSKKTRTIDEAIVRRFEALLAEGRGVLRTRFVQKNVFPSIPCVDYGSYSGWRAQTLTALTDVLGESNAYTKSFETTSTTNYFHHAEAGLSIISKVLDDIKGGYSLPR